MKTIEQLEKENAELRAATERLKSQFKEYMQTADIDIYINAMNKTPPQHLAEIKADAIMEVANNWIIRKDSDYNIRRKLIAISNKLRSES